MEVNKIYNMDCVEGMAMIKEESIDMVITSPPYDSLRNYGQVIKTWSMDKVKQVSQNLFRVLKQGGVVVWVVGDETTQGTESMSSFKEAFIFRETGFLLHDTMIYLKENPCPVGGNKRYYQSFEYMFVFSKGIPSTFNPLTEKRRNKYNDKRTKRFKGFQRNKDGIFIAKEVAINAKDPKRRNVWSYSLGQSDHTGHPAVFPFRLAYDHIRTWSNCGDIILDPFIGSGTTAIAASKLGRKYIGFELNKAYFEKTISRIEEQTCQQHLFLDETCQTEIFA